MLRTEFWKRAARTLPPAVRERHMADLAQAERFELLLDDLAHGYAHAKGAIARAFARPAHQH